MDNRKQNPFFFFPHLQAISLNAWHWAFKIYFLNEIQLHVENIPADSTHKTVWVIGFAQSRDHFSLNEFITTEAPCAIESLVVQSTDVVSLSHKESSLSQVTSTSCRKRKGRLRRLEKENSLSK